MRVPDILGRSGDDRRAAHSADRSGLHAGGDPVFRIRGLTKTYGSGLTEVRALAGVDLDLQEGELIVLLGPSGSGKTTFLNNIGGLDVPTSGELRYRELDLAAADEDRLTQYRRISVGFVFQFYNLIPSLTARGVWQVSRLRKTSARQSRFRQPADCSDSTSGRRGT